jgi:2-phospho-L-lactate guanylyltransferase (CobY/MobA/RfbA family)
VGVKMKPDKVNDIYCAIKSLSFDEKERLDSMLKKMERDQAIDNFLSDMIDKIDNFKNRKVYSGSEMTSLIQDMESWTIDLKRWQY